MKTINKDTIEFITRKSSMYCKINQKIFDIDVNIYSYNYFDLFEFKKFDIRVAREIRGITFVGDEVYPSISKFFNIGENDLSIDYDKLPNSINVIEKLDGTLISPVIINNKVVFKTKNSFYSTHALRVNNMIDNKIKEGIREIINKYNIYPQFEYVSPLNKIVVDYDKEDLVLIAARIINSDGSIGYVPFNELNAIASELGVSMAKYDVLSKTELMEIQKNSVGIEGFVISVNGELYKVKTEWYFEKHKLNPFNLNELIIFNHVINNTIDDVISSAPETLKNTIEEYAHRIISYINKNIEHVSKLYDEWKSIGNKEFAIKYPKETKYLRYFTKGNKIEDIVIDIIRNEHRKLKSVINRFGNLGITYGDIVIISKENVKYNIFGSENSSDVDIIVQYDKYIDKKNISYYKEIEAEYKKHFEDKFGKSVDVNLVNVIADTIVNVYKSMPDLVNNAVFFTYKLHDQEFDMIPKTNVKINILNNVNYAAIKTITFFSRMSIRKKILNYLKSTNPNNYIKSIDLILSNDDELENYVCEKIERLKEIKPIDLCKKIMFYNIQKYLMIKYNIEKYTKNGIIETINDINENIDKDLIIRTIRRELNENEFCNSVKLALNICKTNLENLL